MWRRLGRDSAILTGSVAVMAAFQVGFRLLALRELPVEEYGRVALLIGVFNGALVIGALGIPVTAARLAGEARDDRRDRLLIGMSIRAAMLPCFVASMTLAGVTLLVTGSAAHSLLAGIGVAPMVASIVIAGFLRGKGSVVGSALVQPANALAQLVFLAAAVAGGADVGAGWVLGSFYFGNWSGLALAAVLLVRRLRNAPAAPMIVPAQLRPVTILRDSAWVAAAAFGLVALALAPRFGLARISYEEVAIFDVALLLYSLPQRARASFVSALIPLAAGAHARNERLAVPGKRDVGSIAALVIGVDVILWQTGSIRLLLDAIGLASYASVEPLLILLLLAIPADLLLGLNTGLLTALGTLRPLVRASWIVVIASILLTPIAAALGGAELLAGLFVAAHWALYAYSARLVRACGVREANAVRHLLGSGSRPPREAVT